jgi:regulator of replication initiation timing
MPFNAKHWRERAEEARTAAEQMCDAQSRQQMLEIAEGYERLAQLYKAREPKMVDLAPGAGKAETPGEA